MHIKSCHCLSFRILRAFIFALMLLGILSGTATSVFALEGPFVQFPKPGVSANKFALCAIAQCTTIDKVAYCKCEVLHQESISLPYNYTENKTKKNVCNLLLDGLHNGFTVSTYATPVQALKDYNPVVEKLGPPKALYTCNPKKMRRH